MKFMKIYKSGHFTVTDEKKHATVSFTFFTNKKPKTKATQNISLKTSKLSESL